MADETRTDDWADETKKINAIYKLLRHLANNPKDGLACVGKDKEGDASNLLRDKGEIVVPAGARVIFFGPDEGKDRPLGVGSSVIIRVPPATGYPNATDAQLEQYCILGTYPYWPPKPVPLPKP